MRVHAQPANSYTYEYLNTSHGVASPEVLCLAKDERGFLWLGTAAGLSMYNGYEFQNYAYTAKQEWIGYVNVIKADSAGRLWIGSAAGLYCYTGGDIVKLSDESKESMGINDIYVDGDSTLWLATENGPAEIKVKQIDFTGQKKIAMTKNILQNWPYRAGSPEERRVLVVCISPDHTVFFSRKYDLFRIVNYTIERIYTTARYRDAIQSVFPLSRSKLYFDGAASEINLFDNGTVTAIPYKTLYKPDSACHLPGQWYVGTRGAFYFHPSSGHASRHIFFNDSFSVWPTGVLQDNEFLWIGSHDGLIKLKPTIFNTAYQNDFYSILERGNGNLLVGANKGFVFEKNGDSLALYKKHIVPDAEIKAMYEDERGWLWLGSGYQGLALLRHNKEERFTIESGLHSNSLLSFYKAFDGKLYVCGDQGLSEICVDKNDSISFKPHYYRPTISRYAKFFSITESPDGILWLGGEEGIAYLKNDSLHSFNPNGKRYAVHLLIKDRNDKIWMATSGEGILECRFNHNNMLEVVRQYTEADGLNTAHYISLLADKENNIWAGSSRGISVIGRGGRYKDKIVNFDAADGFIKPGYSHMRLLQTKDAYIYAATTYGMSYFNPGLISISPVAPRVQITRVTQLEDKSIAGKNVSPQKTIVRFPYMHHSFEFSFIALDYLNAAGLRYYYRLKGLDTTWVSSGNRRTANFEKLPHGDYVFEVKALNSKGVWSTGSTTFAFSITAPFWQTWWFLLLLVCVVAGVIFIVVRERVRRVNESAKKEIAEQERAASGYKAQLEIEQIINHFATSMNSLRSVDELLWNVARNCISKLHFEDCVIYLKDTKRNLLIQKAAWGPKMTEENIIGEPIELSPGNGIVGSVALSGVAEIIADTSIDNRYIVDDAHRLSEITVPIISDGQVIGIIDSEHPAKGFYTDHHLQILNTIASLCAVKIKTILAEQQMMEKEIEVLRLSKDVATSQLTALRMQMNPHFIFNALNSIQLYILKGDVIEANKYLSRFSKLQREILHYSTQQFISLQAEIDMLGRYLDLEQNRFGESFTYSIHTTAEIEPEEIKIPPMILQPFVENAIWHGLMPKEKDRSLTITFDLYADDILLAILRDNGIGRAASAKLRQGSTKQHQSRAMSIIEERLQLLQQQYDKPFEVMVSDITTPGGEITGTQVMLKIFIGDKRS
jgi:two-component system, LytTR family, sensor kinase